MAEQTKTETKTEKEFTFHLFAVNLLEKLVEFFKGILTADLLGFCIKWLERIGHLAIIVAAGLGFVFALIFTMKIDKFSTFLYALLWVLVIFVAQYTAHKFLPKGVTLIKNNPTQMSSKAFLDCLGFLSLIGGVALLIMGIFNAINFKSIEPFLWGLGMFVFLELVALISFNPQEVEISMVEDNTAGQEAIGIATFFIKAFMRLVPIFFGIGVVLGTVMLFISFIGVFGSNFGGAFMKGMEDAQQILSATLLPFFSYLIFVFFYLAVDLIKAILAIPGRLKK